MLGISTLRLVVYGIIAAVVLGGAWMLRDELIDKGKNLVYAQDNAAILKAQKQQAADDAQRLKAQAVYIEHLEASAATVKEKIRVVQVPSSACKDDGRSDPRLGDTVDWLRSSRSSGPMAAPDRQLAVPAVPGTGNAAGKR